MFPLLMRNWRKWQRLRSLKLENPCISRIRSSIRNLPKAKRNTSSTLQRAWTGLSRSILTLSTTNQGFKSTWGTNKNYKRKASCPRVTTSWQVIWIWRGNWARIRFNLRRVRRLSLMTHKLRTSKMLIAKLCNNFTRKTIWLNWTRKQIRCRKRLGKKLALSKLLERANQIFNLQSRNRWKNPWSKNRRFKIGKFRFSLMHLKNLQEKRGNLRNLCRNHQAKLIALP